MNKKRIFLTVLFIVFGSFLALTFGVQANWQDDCEASGGEIVEINGKSACSWNASTSTSWQQSVSGVRTSYSGASAVLGSGNFLPPPGCTTHLAQTPDGLTSSGTSCYDPIAPYLDTVKETVSAGHQKTVSVAFDDLFEEERLSGVRTVNLTVSGPTGEASYTGTCSSPVLCLISFTHDFSQTGFYHLTWDATDAAGNFASGHVNNFFEILADIPEWDDANCHRFGGVKVEYETTCPSEINISPSSGVDDTRVADGEDNYSIQIHLADRYGNIIAPQKDIKAVEFDFQFENTVDLNQISKTGDAAEFVAPEINFDLTGNDTGSSHFTSTDWLTEDPIDLLWEAGAKINAACGSANDQSFDTSPEIVNPEYLCASGSTSSSVTRDDDEKKWLWSCDSDSNSTTTNCSADIVIHGVCNSSFVGALFDTPPSPDNLCDSSANTPDILRSSGRWAWICDGDNGGNNEICYSATAPIANKIINFEGPDSQWSGFGREIVIENENIFTGAHQKDLTGSVYVFNLNGELTEIVKADIPEDYSNFGRVIDADNNYLIVGASGENDDQGAVYIFHKDGETWIQEKRLDYANSINFGRSVGISEDYAIVGSLNKAYILHNDEGDWKIQSELLGNNNDDFGADVAISGENIIIGAPGDDEIKNASGAVYFFSTNGDQLLKVTSPDSPRLEYDSDNFGKSVDINGNQAIAGMPYGDFTIFDDPQQDAGLAYIFNKAEDGWKIEQKISPTEFDKFDQFGFNVSIAGNYAIASSPLNTENPEKKGLGATYIFKKNDDKWIQSAKIISESAEEWDRWGQSASVNPNGLVAIGSSITNNGNGGFRLFSDWANTHSTRDGECGISNGKELEDMPTTNLCMNGEMPSVTKDNGFRVVWDWTCTGFNGGGSVSCSAEKEIHTLWKVDEDDCSEASGEMLSCRVYCWSNDDEEEVDEELCDPDEQPSGLIEAPEPQN